jgi:hypothetical protein
MSKLKVDGKDAVKQFPLRTSEEIYDTMLYDAGTQQVSVNVIINNILLKWAKRHPQYQKRILKNQ